MFDNEEFTSKRAYAWAGLFLGFCAGVFSLPKFDAGLVPIPAGAALGYMVGIALFRTRSWPQDRRHQRVLRHTFVWGSALVMLNDLARLADLQTRAEALVVLSLLPAVTLLVTLGAHLEFERGESHPRDLPGLLILLGVLVFCIAWYFAIEWYRTGTLGPLFA